ncbi:MAG: class I SAM-dependent methyltransferase [Flavobacterium sp.]|nr:class I SAM-dependent methyltransferase [Aeromicrobium sp.]
MYESYATTHAGLSSVTTASLVYRRDIRPHLPSIPGARILDVGCGQGALVKLLVADGYDASGVDVSAEQVALAHQAGIRTVVLGDFTDVLSAESETLHAVVATDLLEHLTKDEVLHLFDAIHHALKPGGCFVARTPNANSPFSGNIQYGDFTHETVFTPRSIAQIASATGYSQVDVRPCTPVVHGVQSRVRALAWKAFSGAIKLAIAAETGQRHGLVVTQNMTFVVRRSSD